VPPKNDEIDMSIPGMPSPGGAATTEPKPERTSGTSGKSSNSGTRQAARSGGGASSPAAPAVSIELPTENPYAGVRRVPMNHRVYEAFPQQLAELSQQLTDAGYSPRQASQAELLQMILHDSMPRSVDEAARRIQLWALVKAAPPARR
jgi:hypothetical protein